MITKNERESLGKGWQVSLEARREAARTGRRLCISPATCEIDYTDEDREFLVAIERYKRERYRPFPTWKEVLEVLRSLGYRKVATRIDP